MQSRAEFIEEAIRDKLRTFPITSEKSPVQVLPPIGNFNIDGNRVRILGRTVPSGTSRGRIIDVYFKPDEVWCAYCEATNCQHVKFALSILEVQEILKKKGWKMEE